MMTRTVRSFALAAFFSTGLVAWSGCSTENPDGTPNKLGKAEEVIKKDAQIVGDKVKEEAKIVGDKVKEEAKIVGDKVKEITKPTEAAPTPPVETKPVDAPK